MKSKHLFPVLILTMFVSGCGANVTTHYLVGEKPHVLKMEDWAGEWATDCSGKEVMRIEVLDKEKGIIKLSEAKPGSTSDPVECHLREAGNWTFANAALKPGADYYPVRVKNVEGLKIIAWLPDPEKFKQLVLEKKTLPGEQRGQDISLGLLKREQLEIIMSDKEGVLFKWDEPIILIRRGEAPVP